MVIHKDCNTKKENGCFYGSCYSCDFYTTKNKKGEITYYKWNPVEKKHEIHKVPKTEIASTKEVKNDKFNKSRKRT